MTQAAPQPGPQAPQAPQVVIVRPWTDVHGGGGCCSGDFDGVCAEPVRHRPSDDPVAAAYLGLRAALPQVDVQLVSAGNTAWLVPHVLGRVRRRRGLRAAVRAVGRAGSPGAVLLDGERVAALDDGAAAVVQAVEAAVRGRVGTGLD